jgi:hypothetical protein
VQQFALDVSQAVSSKHCLLLHAPAAPIGLNEQRLRVKPVGCLPLVRGFLCPMRQARERTIVFPCTIIGL